jgi:flagellar basal-body rod protein FlgB
MFENLDVFKMSAALAQYAGQRQAVVSQNVANADTPGFVARDLPDFNSVYAPGGNGAASTQQRATRAGHLHGMMAGQAAPIIQTPGDASPNGNQVSVETEILKSVEAKRQHGRALAIYKSSLSILRSTLSK